MDDWGPILTAAATVAAVLFGVWRMLARCEERNDKAHGELGNRIDRLQTELGNRIDRLQTELGNRIDRVAGKVDKLIGRQAQRDVDQRTPE